MAYNLNLDTILNNFSNISNQEILIELESYKNIIDIEQKNEYVKNIIENKIKSINALKHILNILKDSENKLYEKNVEIEKKNKTIYKKNRIIKLLSKILFTRN